MRLASWLALMCRRFIRTTRWRPERPWQWRSRWRRRRRWRRWNMRNRRSHTNRLYCQGLIIRRSVCRMKRLIALIRWVRRMRRLIAVLIRLILKRWWWWRRRLISISWLVNLGLGCLKMLRLRRLVDLRLSWLIHLILLRRCRLIIAWVGIVVVVWVSRWGRTGIASIVERWCCSWRWWSRVWWGRNCYSGGSWRLIGWTAWCGCWSPYIGWFVG